MKEISIDKFEFSVRTSNCLKRANIFFVSQVMELTVDQMSEIRNMGAKSIQEVLDFQEKIKQMDTLDFQRYELQNEDVDKKYMGPMLMIHKAFPHLVGKEIIAVSFKDCNGILVEDIPVSEIGFSVRTANCLKNNEIKNIKEIAFMEHFKVMKFRNMGNKSVNELITYLREFATCVLEGEKIDTFSTDTYLLIEKRIKKNQNEKEFDISLMENAIKGAIAEIEEKPDYNSLEELEEWLNTSDNLKKILTSSIVIANFEHFLSSTFFVTRDKVSMKNIEEKIPVLFTYEGTLRLALDNLIKSEKIEKIGNDYRKHLPNANDWMNLVSVNEKKAVSLRLEGKTLEECGLHMGITRERVRQIFKKALQKKPFLQEDEYEYWYSEYDLDIEAMRMIFDIDDYVYFYLVAVYKRGERAVEDMLDDSKIESKVYSRLFKYINRNSILIGKKYVPCKRELLCRGLAKENYSNTEATFEEFYKRYLQLLRNNGLVDNPKLNFPSERAFEARMQDSQYILMKYGRRFRYYPINEYDIDSLVKELHLEQFSDVEISTLKLFNEHIDIMEEFDIHDEYELHNLLKKTETIWNSKKYNVVLTRMPLMAFGTVDRAKQTIELLFKVAPVTMEEFGKLYEMEYGVLARTANANMSQYISNYYHDGVYKINQPVFTSEEYTYMKAYMKADFYFIEDVKNIFVKKFGTENVEHVNARTLKELGYRVFTNYIVSNVYSSADEYFTNYIMSNNIIDLEQWDIRMRYIQQAWVALDNLRCNYDILEMEDKKYIRYDHFVNVVNQLSKKELNLYVDEAITFAKEDEYFTIHSLRKKGFENEIHYLGFSNWFAGALVKNTKKVRNIKAGGSILFYQGNIQRTTVDFFQHIMKKLRKIDVELFVDFLIEEYGIVFSKDKIVWIVRNSEMYYDPIMEKIYFDKEEYYNDI